MKGLIAERNGGGDAIPCGFISAGLNLAMGAPVLEQ